MKKLILCVLLFAAFASPIYSQDSTPEQVREQEPVKIWITPEQEARVFRDRAVLEVQAKKITQQSKLIDSLMQELSKYDGEILKNRLQLDSIRKVMYRDSAKISMLERKLDHSAKVIASKDVAIDKWKRGYYQNLRFRKEFVFNSLGKWLEIFGTAGVFGAVVYTAITLAN